MNSSIHRKLNGKKIRVKRDNDDKVANVYVPTHRKEHVDLVGHSFELEAFGQKTSLMSNLASSCLMMTVPIVAMLLVTGRFWQAVLCLFSMAISWHLTKARSFYVFDCDEGLFAQVDDYVFCEQKKRLGRNCDLVAATVDSKGAVSHYRYTPMLIFESGEKFPLTDSPFKRVGKANQIARALAEYYKVKCFTAREERTLVMSLSQICTSLEECKMFS